MGIDTQNTRMPDTEMPDTQLPDSEMPDSDELAWDALAALLSKVEQRLAKALQRQHGLGLSDYRALSRLAADDQGGMRISELAEALALNESSVSRLADRLEQAGLTERCACEDDRRGVYAFITDAGREQLRSAIPTYRAQLAAALDQASADPAVAAPVTALRTARLPAPPPQGAYAAKPTKPRPVHAEQRANPPLRAS
jgi:DNA-binding MarR family transcriptional regulator